MPMASAARGRVCVQCCVPCRQVAHAYRGAVHYDRPRDCIDGRCDVGLKLGKVVQNGSRELRCGADQPPGAAPPRSPSTRSYVPKLGSAPN